MKWVYLVAGHLCIAFGIVGAILPSMPALPFLLGAAFCYSRSSEKYYRWLMDHPVFGTIIRDYQEHRAMRRKTKIIAIAVLWMSLIFSAWRLGALDRWYIGAAFLALAIGVTLIILRVRTLPDKD
jgi:uncharacterized protein